ncbi:MAG: hypothetical protein WCF33_22095 [Pseudonocardiaceae bacterium]
MNGAVHVAGPDTRAFRTTLGPGQRSRHPQRVGHSSRRITAVRAGSRAVVHAVTLSAAAQR